MAEQPEPYQKTLDYLYARLPMFSRIGAAALKPSLDNTLRLCAALGNPHEKFKSVHIAGTNGKGSVSHSLAAIFGRSGYKTGLYTSPHLVDFRERIRVNGEMVSKAWVVDFVERLKPVIEEVQPSFFEITVVMAFAFFAAQDVDIAIIETGLGGRLDSTNVITPELSIITNISYDHADLLGPTLPDIAREKAGIIKPGVAVVVGSWEEDTARVFKRAATEVGSRIFWAEDVYILLPVAAGEETRAWQYMAQHRESGRFRYMRTDLRGAYQAANLTTVLCAVEVLRRQGWNVGEEEIFTALESVASATDLRGRWEVLSKKPCVVADVAHNAAGLEAVLAQWADVKATEKHIVLGFVRDKDVDAALEAFPKDARYYFCNASIPRALAAEELAEKAHSRGLRGESHPSVAAALAAARGEMSTEDALLITGSFFVVGEALEAMDAVAGG